MTREISDFAIFCHSKLKLAIGPEIAIRKKAFVIQHNEIFGTGYYGPSSTTPQQLTSNVNLTRPAFSKMIRLAALVSPGLYNSDIGFCQKPPSHTERTILQSSSGVVKVAENQVILNITNIFSFFSVFFLDDGLLRPIINTILLRRRPFP